MPLVREFETNFESGFAAVDGGFVDAEREERRRTIINWNGSDLSYDSENSTRKRQTHVIDALCATAAASNLYWPTSPKKNHLGTTWQATFSRGSHEVAKPLGSIQRSGRTLKLINNGVNGCFQWYQPRS